MSVKTDVVNLRVIVNGNAAKKELAELDQEYIKLTAQIKNLKKGTDEYIAANKRLQEVQNRMGELRKEVGLNAMTLKELNKEAAKLRMMRQHLTPGTAAFYENEKALKAVQSRIKEVNSGLGPLASAWKKVSLEAKAAVGFLMAGLVWTQIMGVVTGSAQLSDQLADVAKTTGMTDKQLKELQTTLSNYDTRTAKSELLDIAAVGGQLGEQADKIDDFTMAIDKVNVAVGDEFTGGAAQVAEEFGVLRNNLQDIKTLDSAQDILFMSNALNELSAKGAATVPVMVNISNRVGGVLSNMKVTTGQIFGMAASMQELGIAEERGSTAIVKIFQKMISESDKFARIARLPIEDFQTLLNTDLFGAFMKVIEGSRELGSQNTELNAIIQDLEINGAGASEVFSKFGGNMELIRNRVDLATESLGNMDSITNEFNIKNNTLGATLDKLGRDIRSTFINEDVKNSLTDLVNGLADLVKWIKRNGDAFLFLGKMVVVATVAVVSYTLAKKLALLLTTNNIRATVLETLAEKASTAAKAAARAATLLYAAAKAVLAGNITRATAAMRAFSIATKASPLGLLVGFVTAAYIAYQLLSDKTKEAAQWQKDLASAQKTSNGELASEVGKVNALFDALKQTNPQSQERARLIDYINSTYGTTLKNLGDEKAFLTEIAKAQESILDKKRQEIALSLHDKELTILTEAKYEAQEELNKSVQEYSKWREKSVGKGLSFTQYVKIAFSGGKDFEDQTQNFYANMVNDKKEALEAIAQRLKEEEAKYLETVKSLKPPTDNGEGYSSGMSDKEKKALDDQVKAQKASYEEITKWLNDRNSELLTSLMTVEEKIIHEVGAKYAERLQTVNTAINKEKELIAKGVGDRGRLAQLEAAKLRLEYEAGYEAREQLEANWTEQQKKNTADRVEAEKKITEAIASEQQKEEKAVIDHFDQLIHLNKIYHVTEVDLEKVKQEALAKIRDKYAKEKEKKEAKELKEYQKKMKEQMDVAQQVYSSILSITNDILTTIAQREEAEFNNYKRLQDARIKKLQERLDKGLISEEAFNREKERIDAETAAKERAMKVEQFKRQQKADMIMAGIKTALAVVNALATAPWPASIAFAAIAAAAGAAEIAVIASKPVPEFGQGGIFEGPSHDSPSRGMPVVNPETGNVEARFEGNEALIPKKAVVKNRPIVEALIEAGRRDGSLSPVNFRNMTRRMETVERRKYSPNTGGGSASGVDGLVNKRVKLKPTESYADKYLAEMVQLQRELIAENKALKAAIQEEKTRPAILSQRQMEKTTDERNKIRRLAGA